jgi:hypothetical protein
MVREGGGLLFGVAGVEGRRAFLEQRIVLSGVCCRDDQQVVLESQFGPDVAGRGRGQVGVHGRTEAVGGGRQGAQDNQYGGRADGVRAPEKSAHPAHAAPGG